MEDALGLDIPAEVKHTTRTRQIALHEIQHEFPAEAFRVLRLPDGRRVLRFPGCAHAQSEDLDVKVDEQLVAGSEAALWRPAREDYC